MPTWFALLRGINVGGRNKLPMSDLREIMEALGCSDVRTYIQSGNVVFRADLPSPEPLSDAIASSIETAKGFRPMVMLLSEAALRRSLEANPFPEAAGEPKSLHLFYLEEDASAPELERMEALRASSERFELVGRVFYLYAPEGVGRSKLAAGAERRLGVATTARNLRSVMKLLEMASEQD